MSWWVERQIKTKDGWATDARKYRGPFEDRKDATRSAGLCDSFNNPNENHVPWEDTITDTIERPLSAEVADAAQKRLEGPQSLDFATGAVIPRMEYEIQCKTAEGSWEGFSRIGEKSFREAIWEFRNAVGGWDPMGWEFRLAKRPVAEWETSITQEGLKTLRWNVRGEQ